MGMMNDAFLTHLLLVTAKVKGDVAGAKVSTNTKNRVLLACWLLWS